MFIFALRCGASKDFMKTVKAFNFFSSLGSERKGMKFSAFIGGSEGNTEKKCIN